MSDLNQFGSPGPFRIGPISTDRFGVLSAQVFVERREDPTDFDLSLFLPGNEPKFIVPCQGRQRSYKGGIATYTFSYEGGAPSADFAERIFCDLEGSDSEEPIETHPNWMAIAEKYNAQFDRSGQFSHFARKLKDGKENPVYGATQFLSMGMVWTCTLIVRELPGNECDRVGCIDRPQGHLGMQPPSLGGRRNWLRVAPQARQRGNVIQLSRRWMASGRNGWNKDFYTDKGVSTGGPQGGLISGGLTTGTLTP